MILRDECDLLTLVEIRAAGLREDRTFIFDEETISSVGRALISLMGNVKHWVRVTSYSKESILRIRRRSRFKRCR
jgi:hypothetical protein